MEKMLFIGGPYHGQQLETNGQRVTFMAPHVHQFSISEEADVTLIDDYQRGYGYYSVRPLGTREGGVIYQREVMVREGMEDTRAMIELRELLINQWLKREALT